MGRRIEVALVVVLVVAVGLLAVGRALAPQASRTPAEDPSSRGTGSLDCLQDLMVGQAAPPPVGEGVGDLADAVEDVRGLRFTDPPEPTYLTRPEFSRRVAAYANEYSDEDADEDERILTALAAIEPGTDLKALLRAALSEQVAGFYDPDTRELVVGAGDPEALSFLERVTLAHELEHALADQTLGLPLERDEVPEGEEDAQAAATALIEGDATLTMALVSLRLAGGDPASLLGEGLGALGGHSAELPHHVQRSLLFPYEEGLAFTCELYAKDGWDAVNAAYRAPPTSTAEVLFPERYGSVPQPLPPLVSAGPDPAQGWMPRTVQAFGAADLLFLFEAPAGDPDRALRAPRRHVAAWRAGEVQLWTRGSDSAIAVRLGGAPRLCASVRAWQRAVASGGVGRFGVRGSRSSTPGGATVVTCEGAAVRIGVGPDVATAGRLAAGRLAA